MYFCKNSIQTKPPNVTVYLFVDWYTLDWVITADSWTTVDVCRLFLLFADAKSNKGAITQRNGPFALSYVWVIREAAGDM